MDELEASLSRRFLAMAFFKSERAFNPRYLFEDMAAAWRIGNLASVQCIEEKKFLLEFKPEDELTRVVTGGPWIHKGDALLVMHYDGVMQPSPVTFDTIPLWIRLYDLPPLMRNEEFVEKIGGRFGKFVQADLRFLSYLRIRVLYPLKKVLLPKIWARYNTWWGENKEGCAFGRGG